MKKIGRIKYVTKGVYDPDVAYTDMNVVLYGGSLWECIKDSQGNAPPENQRDEDGYPARNEFWSLFLPGALGDDYVKKTDIAAAPTETEPGRLGISKPDGKTILISENGELSGSSLDYVGTMDKFLKAIESGEVQDGTVGFLYDEDDDLSENPTDSMLQTVDDALSKESKNAVQNKVITEALAQKAGGAGIAFTIEDGILYASYDDGAGTGGENG